MVEIFETNNSEDKSKDSSELAFNTGNGIEYIVTEEGSVGLLALGAAGLKAWRKVRFEAAKKRKEENKIEENSDTNFEE